MNTIDILNWAFPADCVCIPTNAKIENENGNIQIDAVFSQPDKPFVTRHLEDGAAVTRKNVLRKLRLSTEAIQDMSVVLHNLFSVRAKPIELNEIVEWTAEYARLNNINMDEVRRRVQIDHKEVPYVDFGCWDEESVGAYENV